MEPVVLFRCNRDDADAVEEFRVVKEHFQHVITARAELQFHTGKMAIARYSALPYYKELEEDCKWFDVHLINSYEQHRWIANFEYYEPLKAYTPETREEHSFGKWDYEGPFVVKGKTNSRKHRWNQDMFAENKEAAWKIASTLHNDMWIGEQGLIFRKYVPLKTFEIGLFGLPFTNEWRFFYYKGERISYDYYWSIADNPELGKITEEGLAFADEVAAIAAKYTNFYVLDIAEKADGGWILIEINDGQMSGLSMINPESFYKNLANVVRQ